ncbi:protein kinase domain containing protein [Stylonychia lemnae]|uniref:Protein kinase domain containing protein n=1 Tax=Stylonychia lemnae TaxID=5949 RepID=A0A078AT45_STYLE|nr:protein kinase domain containing protein [Stylonychia lemnae]|eukprot:CDW85359.1 protein kinase domain containing protein [Stylonychia lemnae]
MDKVLAKQGIILLVNQQNLYLEGRSLGQGTFGKVRLGTHMLTGEKVAIKILEKDKIKDQSDVERVTREIHILKIVRHPNVIQLYEIIETSRQLFLIMEYASGGELFDFIVKRKRLQETDACKFFQQIIQGVEYIHKLRICHRDLKPENLLLDERNNIKIVDFGLSNIYKEGDTLKTACGSPCYAAPEMIAGKKYQGLISDTWSCGIILYAMACGYLPFEDPNTNKLYKKILSCDYLIPGFISAQCKDLIKKILNTDPNTRISMKDVKAHEWFNQVKFIQTEGILVGKDKIPVIEEVMTKLVDQFGPESNPQNLQFVLNNKHNQVTSTYYLIVKKMDRDLGKNHLFELFNKEKRKLNNMNSTSQMSFGTPQTKINLPQKMSLNQTVSSGFSRAMAQNSTKSDGKNQRKSDQITNPVTKIYLEQMDKIYTKRTESTGQTRASDSLTNYAQIQQIQDRPTKSGNGFETKAFQQRQYQGVIRATQSQSPDSKIISLEAKDKMTASAGAPLNNNQTLFMADRLRKNNHQNNRPSSIDENLGNMIIASTNDSRIQEILPNVQRSNNNKSANMRQTMYNNPYLNKLNNLINKQHVVLAEGSINSDNQTMRPIQIKDQKKQENSFLITTQYKTTPNTNLNNSTNNPSNIIQATTTNFHPISNNNTVISKALAQQKVRKYRNQNRNISNNIVSEASYELNQTQPIGQTNQDNSYSSITDQRQGGDQKMYTIYRPKKQAKLTNQFTNRPSGNQSFDYNISENASLISNENMNNSFTGPNSTQSRFYNPHKHNRFLSNNYNTNMKQSNIPVFQNNFVVPISFNSAIATKTFYNMSKPAPSNHISNKRPSSPRNNVGPVACNNSINEQSHQSTATNSHSGYQSNIINKQVLILKKQGVLRELNPGPPAPEAGIIPLDQVPKVIRIPNISAYVSSKPQSLY